MANMSRSEAGRLGAKALNEDPQKKSAAAKKAAETRKKENPNVFREMGAKGGGAHGKGKMSDEDNTTSGQAGSSASH